MKHDDRSVAFRILGFAMFPLGLGALIIGTHDIIEGRQSLRWPATEAVVLSSVLSSRPFEPPQPEIRYRYSVDGQPRVSDRLWAGSMDNLPILFRKKSEEIISPYKPGKTVTAYVDKRNGNAVLFAGPARADRFVLVVIFFLGLGAWAPFALDLLIKNKRNEAG